MSDNLEVARECGFKIKSYDDIMWLEETDSLEPLNKYTSRILASQQAAHDAEIAKLKEELAGEQDVYADTNKALNHVVDELSTANERIAHLEGLVALQADALNWARTDVSSQDVIAQIDEAISASAETVQLFRDKLDSEAEARGAAKALEDFGEPFKFSYPWIYNECKKKAEERRATSKKAG